MATVVHDYLTQRGGAERVVLAILRAFPSAPLHTAIWSPEACFPEFGQVDVRTLPIGRVGAFRHDHRRALPLLARAFDRLHVDDDVVVCSSSAWAHGTTVQGRKVVYCHTPPRWLHQPQSYRVPFGPLGRAGMAGLRSTHRAWDARAAASADVYIVNSTVVRDRVRDAYGIDAEVVAPPHGVNADGARQPVEGLEPGFVLNVSRLLPYKNVDVVCAAAGRLPGERVVVVGAGPEEARLRRAAPPNVVFLGERTDAELRWLYASCAVLVAASHEDFGLTPLEAAAFGAPTVALGAGGYLDTILPGVTGVLVSEATPAAVADGVGEALSVAWDERAIVAHAERFGEARFARRLREVAGVSIGDVTARL